MSKNPQLEKLWCVASDLRSIIDLQAYGTVLYFDSEDETGENRIPIQETATYRFAVSALQEVEQELFGKILTYPMTRELAQLIADERESDSDPPVPIAENEIPARNCESVV